MVDRFLSSGVEGYLRCILRNAGNVAEVDVEKSGSNFV